MPKSVDLDEAEVAAALEEKRLDAVKLAVPQLLQLEREIAAKNKRKSEIFQGLENRGIDKLAFKEALKRARRDSEQLDLFDEEAAALEPMIRGVLLGITLTNDKKAAATAKEAEERQEKQAKAAKPKKAAKEKAAPKAAKKAKKGAGSADQGPTEGRQPEPVKGDPDFRQKIARVAPGEGAEGFSANDIPMPGQEHRPPQPSNVTDINQARGFVDKTPRMSAAEARKVIGADDDVLGHG